MATQKATLYGPDGKGTVVEVGSSKASQLQSQGYGLTPGSFSAPTEGRTGIDTGTTVGSGTPPPPTPKQPTTTIAPITTQTTQKATLYGPGGTKVVVDVGSQQASSLQSQGYGLTAGSYKEPAAFGETAGGERFGAQDPDVIAFMEKYPDVSLEVAIGSVAGSKAKQVQTATPTTAVTSDAAKQQALADQAELAQQVAGFSAQAPGAGTEIFGVTDEDRYGKGDAYDERLAELEADYQTFNDALTSRMESLDSANQNAVLGIQAEYAKKKKEMDRLNQNRATAKEIIGTQSGRQRYAAGIQADIIDKEVMDGVARLDEIDAAERNLIAQAERAHSEQQWEALGMALSAKRQLFQDKNAVIEQMHKIAMDKEGVALKRAAEARAVKKDLMSDLSAFGTAGKVLTAESGAQMDALLGSQYVGTGFSEAYTSALSSATKQDQANAWIDTAMSLPYGETVQTPFGTTIKGLNKDMASKGVSSFRETNDLTGEITEIVTKFNPETQKMEILDIISYGTIGTPVGAPGVAAPKVVKVNGVDSTWNPNTGTFEPISVGAADPAAAAAATQKSIDNVNITVTEIQELIDHKGLNNAVGFGLGRVALAPWQWDDKASFIGGVERLVKNQALDALVQAKKDGATFGAMSNAEWDILEKSRSNITQWREVDKNGKTTGYKIGEDEMVEELERLQELAKKALDDVDWSKVSGGQPGAGPTGPKNPTSYDSPLQFLQETQNAEGISPYKPAFDDVIEFYQVQGIENVSPEDFNAKLQQMLEADGVVFSSDLSMSVNGSNISSIGSLQEARDKPLTTVKIGGQDIQGKDFFVDAIAQADAEFFAATGQHIKINQDYRSTADQQAIRDRFGYTSNTQASGSGGLALAAQPGHSWHNHGMAVDVSNWQDAQPYLEKYGIVNGLKGDMGHFSVGEMNPGIFV